MVIARLDKLLAKDVENQAYRACRSWSSSARTRKPGSPRTSIRGTMNPSARLTGISGQLTENELEGVVRRSSPQSGEHHSDHAHRAVRRTLGTEANSRQPSEHVTIHAAVCRGRNQPAVGMAGSATKHAAGVFRSRPHRCDGVSGARPPRHVSMTVADQSVPRRHEADGGSKGRRRSCICIWILRDRLAAK